MQEPGQEGGSQKLKRSRSEGATDELEDLAGGCQAVLKEVRRLVEVRVSRWKCRNGKRETRDMIRCLYLLYIRA